MPWAAEAAVGLPPAELQVEGWAASTAPPDLQAVVAAREAVAESVASAL